MSRRYDAQPIASVSAGLERIVLRDGHHAGQRLLIAEAIDSGNHHVFVDLPEHDATTLRDALTSWLDAPRDAARAAAEVVTSEQMVDVTTALLKTAAGEWGVRTTYSDDEVASDLRWYSGKEAEREARAFFAEIRGKSVCECGAEMDENEAIGTEDGDVCQACAEMLHEEWLASTVECIGRSVDEQGRFVSMIGCGWTGKGADAAMVGNVSTRRECPTCGGDVELVEDAAPGGEAARP